MEYAKIIVKSDYEKRGDLVLRSYIRALKKAGKVGELLLNGDEALIYGVIDLDGNFHELFTNNIIDYSDHSELTKTEYQDLCSIFIDLSDDEVELLQKVMEKALFKRDIELSYEISTIEELAKDRAIEFDAYNSYLSRINPYQRLTEENPNAFNDYNNFLRKVEEIRIMKKMDSKNIEEFDEYIVLENPKRLIKK